jgi:hypothetical protein
MRELSERLLRAPTVADRMAGDKSGISATTSLDNFFPMQSEPDSGEGVLKDRAQLTGGTTSGCNPVPQGAMSRHTFAGRI